MVSGVLKMESFGAEFPRIYLDSGFKGWFVSTLLLAAWLGSLVNGPIADRFGRKGSMLAAVVVFVLGSGLQAGARSIGVLFAGETSFQQCDRVNNVLTMDVHRSRNCRFLSGYVDHDCAHVHVRSIDSWDSRYLGRVAAV